VNGYLPSQAFGEGAPHRTTNALWAHFRHIASGFNRPVKRLEGDDQPMGDEPQIDKW
jgi:hypothetical protein